MMIRTHGLQPLVMVVIATLLVVGCQTRSSKERATAVPCDETPAQDRWPGIYGLARGQKEIWLVDNGGAHGVGAQRKVAWRVVGGVDRLNIKGKRLEGSETLELTIADRVSPNGQDYSPQYWDAVSYLTFPAAGCWELDLRAGEKHERITLDVR